MIFISTPNYNTSIKNSFSVLGSWDANENLAEPLRIDIYLSEFIPARWNLGGHIMIFDMSVIVEEDVFSSAFDFKSVDVVNQNQENGIVFGWAIPKVKISIDNLRGGYRKDGARYIIEDIEQVIVSSSVGNVTFSIREMGYLSPIFFSTEVVMALHLLGVAGRTFKPLRSY